MGMGRCRIPLVWELDHLARPTCGDSSRLCSLSVGLSHVAVRYCVMDSIEVDSIWYSSDRQSSFLRSGHFLRNRSSPLRESTEYNELSFHRDIRESKNGDAVHSTQTEHRAK